MFKWLKKIYNYFNKNNHQSILTFTKVDSAEQIPALTPQKKEIEKEAKDEFYKDRHELAKKTAKDKGIISALKVRLTPYTKKLKSNYESKITERKAAEYNSNQQERFQ